MVQLYAVLTAAIVNTKDTEAFELIVAQLPNGIGPGYEVRLTEKCKVKSKYRVSDVASW